MDIKITKDKRGKGVFYHKTIKGVNSSKCKEQASLDISEYIKECESFYNRNYIYLESKVLILCSLDENICSINTNLL